MAEHFRDLALGTPLTVEARRTTPVVLSPQGSLPEWLAVSEAEIRFTAEGWYEVLMTVEWDPRRTDGTRFSHTSIPDHHPLHSEAIAADVLAQVSGGRQMLRGNSVFSPDGPSSLTLEVWHDSAGPVTVQGASLQIRRLTGA